MNKLIERGREIVMDSPQLLVDFDAETDGIAGHGSMLSMGGITPDGETYYVEMQPASDVWIDKQRQFCEDHGLERERLIREGVPPARAMYEFREWTLAQAARHGKKARMVAFNAGFDHGFVSLYFVQNKLENPYGTAPFDLKSLAMALRPGWDWEKTHKAKLPPEILPEGDFTHNAIEDAGYQQKIHFASAAMLEGMHRRLASMCA